MRFPIAFGDPAFSRQAEELVERGTVGRLGEIVADPPPECPGELFDEVGDEVIPIFSYLKVLGDLSEVLAGVVREGEFTGIGPSAGELGRRTENRLVDAGTEDRGAPALGQPGEEGEGSRLVRSRIGRSRHGPESAVLDPSEK